MFSSASGWLDIAVERCDHECDQGQAKVENTALVKCHGMRCQPSSDQLSFAGPGLPSGIVKRVEMLRLCSNKRPSIRFYRLRRSREWNDACRYCQGVILCLPDLVVSNIKSWENGDKQEQESRNEIDATRDCKRPRAKMDWRRSRYPDRTPVNSAGGTSMWRRLVPFSV